MVWAIEYIIYSIIIVFLIDKVYNFLQNNNGVYETRIIKNSPGNVEWKHYDKQNENDHNEITQPVMEEELNKLFQSDENEMKSNKIVHEQKIIESSNILDLPIDV